MSTKTNVPAATVRAWGRENLDAVKAFAVSQMPKADRDDADKVSAVEAASIKSLTGNEGTSGARGRLGQAVIGAFKRANKSKTYEAKVAEGSTITVSYRALDAKGRTRRANKTMSTDEARALYGGNSKGRVSTKRVVAALEADWAAAQEPTEVPEPANA